MRMGTQELIIVFAIVFLLFGASRLPQLGSSLGSAIRNFKKGFGGEADPNEKPAEKQAEKPAIAQGGDANKASDAKVAEKQS
ncbi:MAG: twin-arginine translocase TatA/TatE family subunit [Myxococcaceae bacterium]|nr:twin-arginine translocase TatA/TatE family subunit [Myxococcaceae bacterium]